MPVPLVAAAGVAGEVSGFITGLGGGTSAQRDKARFAQADALFLRAQNGDAAARAELVRLSTNFATAPAKQYAATLVARLSPSAATTPLPNTPSAAPPGGPRFFGGDMGTLVLVGVGVVLAIVFVRGR